ncbi:MAG: HNH endonuclease [Actinomycetes bacterium]|nr:HNH endonuclease [Actinomycetes bacterium]MDX5379941.1 HNH endonuclease [Actinomycetes bacterium]MDX5398448.1 HNH endonuclease [Actinomycetes bacterium]MDX5449653.1 HNH endonuclease [Actinomycetes bacterium]
MFAGVAPGDSQLSHAPVAALADAVTALEQAWAEALPPFGVNVGDGDPSVVVDQFSDAGLLTVVTAVGALTRRVEGLGAVLAAEVARRSPAGTRTGNLARTAGHASPGSLVAASRGGHLGRAVDLVKVGEGTAARRALSGEPLPAAHPHVAQALHAGTISVDAAHLIIGMLDRVAPRANPVQLEATEAALVENAPRLSYRNLVRAVGHAAERLDPDGKEPREDAQHRTRSLTISQDATGIFHLKGTLDPETGAPIKTALDSYVTARLRETRGNNNPATPDSPAGAGAPGGEGTSADAGTSAGSGVLAETRSIPQLQADALADFARHILACDTTVPLVPAVTMVVRIDLGDLRGDIDANCLATIDGVDQPLSAAAARRLACDAGLIPAVFGGPSVPLDLGRRSRTFTRAQVLALWERDGGCAFCGQTSFVEAHHVRWWHRDHGTTDLSNGVLLCSRCHHLIHRDGWGITIDEAGEVTFTPPLRVDPDRVPRPAAPNPRRLDSRPSPSRPPDRDDARRPPTGPNPATPRTHRCNPAVDERRRE